MGPIFVILILLAVGFFVGGSIERKHFAELEARSKSTSSLVTQLKSFPYHAEVSTKVPEALYAEVVISSDYLKTLLAGLRNIFGGQVNSFQSLLIRARKEALQRLVEEAEAKGFNAICNVRLETAQIGGGTKKGVMMVAIQATATAYEANAPTATSTPATPPAIPGIGPDSPAYNV